MKTPNAKSWAALCILGFVTQFMSFYAMAVSRPVIPPQIVALFLYIVGVGVLCVLTEIWGNLEPISSLWRKDD